MYLRPDELLPGVNILGSGADGLAAVLASSCAEVGLGTLVLDFDGNVAKKLSGRFGVSSLGQFLYDSQRMEEKSSLHAELAASAYTMALNLNFEQEGFLNSAIQYIALEQGVASPASLNDRLSATGEFRGHTADELRGKLGALRSLNLIGDEGIVKKMLERNTVASFAGAESQQAAEVAVMLTLAKVLAIGASGGKVPDVLVVNGANRIFSNLPLTRHSNRLLTTLLSAPMARLFAAESVYGLDHHFIETSPVRILSSGLWNEIAGGGASISNLYSHQHSARRGTPLTSVLILTPNMFVLQDSARGYEEVFVPRNLPELEANSAPAAAEQKKDESAITKKVLEALSTNDHATRGSVVAFLSAEDPVEELEKTIDRLQSEGYVEAVGKDVKRDNPLSTFRLTAKGYDLMRRLS
jgi:hypothetical protein